jgi:hypothetical protein
LEEEVWGGDGDHPGLGEVGEQVTQVLAGDDPVVFGEQVKSRHVTGFELVANVYI